MYVPAALTLGEAALLVKPFGPVQPTIVPFVLAVRVTLPVAHVIIPPVALTVGAVASSVTVAVPVAVHPFADCTVTVYVPAALTLGEAALLVKPFGPVQLTIVPFVFAVRVTLAVPHVITPPVALTVGGVASSVTVAVAVSVHPFVDCTVTVYVPAALTLGDV